MEIVTCTAPVNIAVIKYWGKRDEKLILPLNDSISFTLSQDHMCARTTVALSENYEGDRFWLNGKEESMDNPRIQNCLRAIRERVDLSKGNNKDILRWGLRICSSNNFPTAAGLASSAAGYACLVYGLSKAYGIEGDLSQIARQGSGSACRSMDGGLVHWYKGEQPDGSDSFAQSIAAVNHWPDLHVLICVANAGRKKTPSTEGMRRSIRTSRLMQYRVKESVITRIKDMTQAIENKDWSTFCDLTIADSNEMHAVCLDTFPPCIYMNDTSHRVAALVHRYNDQMVAQGKKDLKIWTKRSPVGMLRHCNPLFADNTALVEGSEEELRKLVTVWEGVQKKEVEDKCG
ncbi:mevalonate diphosphate decarboxylase isoform X2 [Oratosquilla oratoria]|uniref:mevalonate diphosphate decarboxylase isoform X2 n=1 Tax=Oratosquilla oratoria TaxID=337810 RepID=UPI003F75C57A